MMNLYLVRVYEHNDNIISSESTYGGLNRHLFKCATFFYMHVCICVDIEHKLVDLLPCHVPACPCTKWTPQICTESSRVRKSRRHFVLLSKFVTLTDCHFANILQWWDSYFWSVFLTTDCNGSSEPSCFQSQRLTVQVENFSFFIAAAKLIAECSRRTLWRTWEWC